MTSPAYPLEVEPSGQVRRMNAAERERFIEFWDAGTQEDERRAEEEWLALSFDGDGD